ncbi:hypothetical protein [Mesorhizobium sp. B2-3-4]|uniref:hypothetical protein n=1 Tax=Mesorhizobium sp. B2-3-4 TaxID=2589959 RepID=UPI00112CB785|nr:hypothetical protein [Mesorhizobium sp. B2-3-4]TPM30873.1 hypothetical protein FJ967_25770 [Mesorhizobium sp. B2-3-4]
MSDPGAGADDAGFRFVMDADEAPAGLDAVGVDPADILSLADGAYLGLHLLPVTMADADHFDSRDHVREDGKRLRCASFYVDRLDATAFAGVMESGAVAALDGGHVARMTCICDRLTPALRRVVDPDPQPEPARDVQLVRLLRRLATPGWAQADEVAKGFPDPMKQGAAYGGYMALSDLVRLIWVHEWAHILLGHVDIVSAMGQAGRLDEHSPRRADGAAIEGMPWPHILQAFELQADQFAVSFATQQILRGYDPAGAMAGPETNLIHRLCMLAAACAVFAVDAELKQGPRDPNTATHPSAALRYMCMLQQIDGICVETDPGLGYAQFAAFNLIGDLARLCEDFHGLLEVTPMIAKTPKYKAMLQVADYLFNVGGRMDAVRRPYVYLPRR